MKTVWDENIPPKVGTRLVQNYGVGLHKARHEKVIDGKDMADSAPL